MHKGNKPNSISVTDLTCKLTWHDPLTDELLSCASLLKLELENCMKTEARKKQRRESVISEPHGQQSIHHIHIHEHTKLHVGVQKDTKRTCALRQQFHPLISLSSFCFKSNRRRVQSGSEQTTTYFLFYFPPFYLRVEERLQKENT